MFEFETFVGLIWYKENWVPSSKVSFDRVECNNSILLSNG